MATDNVTRLLTHGWWQELEQSPEAAFPHDAWHCVNVYDQLLTSLTQLRRDFDEDELGQARVTRYVREAEARRRYWLSQIPTEHPSA